MSISFQMASISVEDAPLSSIRNTNFELRLMARVLAGLFGAGATLALATILLPHNDDANELGLIVIVANAYVVAAVLYLQAGRVPYWLLPTALAWGTALITGVAHFSGESPSPLIFFYLWIFLYSAYFFGKRMASLQIAFVGLLYGVLLLTERPEGGFASWWLVGIGSMLVGALVIGVMRQHVEELITRLHEAARTDPLTMLTNRRGFREQLDLEIERARRSGTAMTVALGDIDHFKHVNDHSGHQVGDIALTRIGQVLLGGKRVIDFVSRIGGEEFALIFPDSEGASALGVAERLREDVRREFSADPVQLTISFGIAQYPTHGETASSLLRAVDEALYEAKESGRNRTVLHTDALRGRRKGYPHGLSGSELSLESQIIAVADAYEAMTSDRAYRDAIGDELAKAELERCSGSQFEPRVVEAFLAASRSGSARTDQPLAPV